jgi:hypothetical protein
MAAIFRYRYKGQFVSSEKAQKLSNLKGASKYVTKEAISELHYRYKGRFVSKEDAKRLSHLPATKKALTTEIRHGDIKRAKQGYEISIEDQTLAALAAERQKSAERYKATRTEKAREAERLSLERLSKAAARQAADEDISIEEALDAQGFEPDNFEYFGFEEAESLAEGFLDEGEGFFDFDIVDLEADDQYPNE